MHEFVLLGVVERDEVFGASMKSVKVLSFLCMRPASCQGLPSSPPPRMWAMAKAMPRSMRLKRLELNETGMEIP